MSGQSERVTIDPAVCSGKPCIRGTRIPVHIILDLLAAGETHEGVRRAYPHIEEADIRACLEYAAELAREEAGVLT